MNVRKFSLKHLSQNHLSQLILLIFLLKGLKRLIYKKIQRTKRRNEKDDFFNECGQFYLNETTLESHRRTSISDDCPYKCDGCDRTFRAKFELRRHCETIDDNGFQCNKCGELFKYKCILTNHYRTHFLRKFKCVDCDKSFKTKDALVKHRKLTHIMYV